MEMKYQYSDAQIREIKAARKANKNKRIDKRLQVLEMRMEGKTQREMQQATGFCRSNINLILKKYAEEGLSAIAESHYKGNRRNLSVEEEAELLEPFKAKAEAGQMIEVGEIKAAYVEKVGHSIGNGQIYYVLKRQGWRKVMPRSQHPNKADEEAISASKKLSPRFSFWEPK